MKVEKGLYYPYSENKGADQLRGYREADLRLYFRICRFSHDAAQLTHCSSNANKLNLTKRKKNYEKVANSKTIHCTPCYKIPTGIMVHLPSNITCNNTGNPSQGVQGKGQFCRIFEIIIFCFAVAIFDLVHAVETIFHLHLLLTASGNLS